MKFTYSKNDDRTRKKGLFVGGGIIVNHARLLWLQLVLW